MHCRDPHRRSGQGQTYQERPGATSHCPPSVHPSAVPRNWDSSLTPLLPSTWNSHPRPGSATSKMPCKSVSFSQLHCHLPVQAATHLTLAWMTAPVSFLLCCLLCAWPPPAQERMHTATRKIFQRYSDFTTFLLEPFLLNGYLLLWPTSPITSCLFPPHPTHIHLPVSGHLLLLFPLL